MTQLKSLNTFWTLEGSKLIIVFHKIYWAKESLINWIINLNFRLVDFNAWIMVIFSYLFQLKIDSLAKNFRIILNMVQLHQLFADNCEKDGFRTLILKPWIHGDLIRTQKTPWPSWVYPRRTGKLYKVESTKFRKRSLRNNHHEPI